MKIKAKNSKAYTCEFQKRVSWLNLQEWKEKKMKTKENFSLTSLHLFYETLTNIENKI